MTQASDTSHLRLASPWLLRLLAVIGGLLTVVSFVGTSVFVHRGLANDTQGAVATTMIGTILLIASFLAYRTARKPRLNAASRKRNAPIRITIAFISLVALFGGIDFAWMSVIVINQDYLHWFYSSRSFGPSGGSMNSLLADFVVTAFILTGIGTFLLWFSVLGCCPARTNPDQQSSSRIDGSGTDDGGS